MPIIITVFNRDFFQLTINIIIITTSVSFASEKVILNRKRLLTLVRNPEGLISLAYISNGSTLVYVLPPTMRTPVHMSKTFQKLHLLHIKCLYLSSAQSVVYALWEEVPKLVYYRLICKPVILMRILMH